MDKRYAWVVFRFSTCDPDGIYTGNTIAVILSDTGEAGRERAWKHMQEHGLRQGVWRSVPNDTPGEPDGWATEGEDWEHEQSWTYAVLPHDIEEA